MPGKTKDKKDKTKSTGPKVRNKNAKLQLKGRIFMTNVTEVVAMSKTGKHTSSLTLDRSRNTNRVGSYTVQIWWKGDPGVENFMIKFQNEDTMKKWAAGLDKQRQENAPQFDQKAIVEEGFAWIKNMPGGLKNPHVRDLDEDEDEEDEPNGSIMGTTPTSSQASTLVAMPGTIQRNSSSNSLHRQRSLTGDSTHPMANIGRAAPPRFPMPLPAQSNLSLQTQGQASPLYRPAETSYFSPTAESPASRASTISGVFNGSGYPFPKTSTPQPWNPEDSNRYTAPAMPRAPSRDGPSPANGLGMNGRNPRGPSMPVMPRDSGQSSQLHSRIRSHSTPDINGQSQRTTQPVPAVPGIPAHLHQHHPPHPTHARHDSNIPRSNAGSPANDLPIRTNTSSPGTQRIRTPYGGTMAQFPTQPVYPRQGTPGSGNNLPPPGPPPPGMAPLAPMDPSRSITPGLATAPFGSANDMVPPTPDIMPNQLKVKVNCDLNGNGVSVTLVAQFNITYQSLIDRIDVKLARVSNSSIARGDLKLRYQDEDGDFVTIEGDDDIQIAISEWREGQSNMPGGLGEIELFCVSESSSA